MDQVREDQAISAYAKFLQTKKVDSDALKSRAKFVKKLIARWKSQ